MSAMLGSFSSGSSGPSPVISSRISETKSLSSSVLSASRSTRIYWVTSCWMCARICSSDSFSSAERLTSSISGRCRRTLASSSLSLSSGLAGAATGSADGSGNTVQETPSSPPPGSSATTGSAAVARRAVKRPTIRLIPVGVLPRQRELEFLAQRRDRRGRRLGGHWRDQLLELERDLIARLDALERNA